MVTLRLDLIGTPARGGCQETEVQIAAGQFLSCFSWAFQTFEMKRAMSYAQLTLVVDDSSTVAVSHGWSNMGDHSAAQRNPYWEIISSGQGDLSGFWTMFKLQRCGRLRPDGMWVCSRHLGYSWSRLHASCACFSGQPLEKLALWPSMATEIVSPVLGTFPNGMIQTFPNWIGMAMRLWCYGYSNWHNWNDSIFLVFNGSRFMSHSNLGTTSAASRRSRRFWQMLEKTCTAWTYEYLYLYHYIYEIYVHYIILYLIYVFIHVCNVHV